MRRACAPTYTHTIFDSTQEQAINEAILREREEEIREIHQNVTKVNEVGD